MGLFEKIIAPIRKFIGVRTFEDEKRTLTEANRARKKRDYRTALELYKKSGNYYWAGKMAEKLGDDGYAIRLYETDRNDWDIPRLFPFSGSEVRTDRENIPKYLPKFKEAARLYEKLGNWKAAFNLLQWYQYHYEAGKIAEKVKDYSSAIDEYKKALRGWEARRRPDLRQEKISKLKQKIEELERKKDRELSHKKDKGLTSKLSLFIITLVGFGASIFFLSPSITGNSIANLNITDSSWMGVVSFVLSLFLGFFWIRSNKE